MPIQDCTTKGGKKGKKFGEKGKCYTGPDAEEKAAKQGRAIEWSKHKDDKKKTVSREEHFLETW